MAVKISIDVDLRNVNKYTRVKTPAEFEKALRLTSAKYLTMQRENVNNGVDIDGIAFQGYSLEYGQKKAAAGRMEEGYWLRLTGHLFRSQRTRYSRRGGFYESKTSFEGTHPRVKFSRGAKGRRQQKQAMGGPGLTVNLAKGAGSSNEVIARQNNRLRKFIGVSHHGSKELHWVLNAALYHKSRTRL